MRYFILLGALIAVFSISSVSAAIVNVPADQPTIQAAVDAANEGDTVLVAAGTYTGTGNRDIELGSKALTIQSASGASTCIIDCQGSYLDWHRAFRAEIDNSSPVIKGFTIKNGFADRQAGAIYISQANPTIISCIFINNVSFNHGGAIHIYDANPIISNCTFTANTAGFDTGDGGAISMGDAEPVIVNSEFTQNFAFGNGGAISCTNLGARIAYCTIAENISLAYGGGIDCRSATPYITNTTLVFNTAEYGGALSFLSGSYSPVTNCEIDNNFAFRNGGGAFVAIYAFQTTNKPVFTNCTISDNQANNFGGGIFATNSEGEFTILNSILWGNTVAAGNGNNIALQDDTILTISSSTLEGGREGIYLMDSDPIINWGTGMVTSNPLFASGAYGDYYLSQQAAGQSSDSPSVNAGSAPASEVCFETHHWFLDDTLVTRWMCMDTRTTRTDNVVDDGTVDHGYHYIPAPFFTPTPSSPGVALTLNKSKFKPGDNFLLQAIISNSGPETYTDQPFVVVLEAFGLFYFYPTWGQSFEFEPVDLGIEQIDKTIMQFNWPDGVGSGSGVCFHGALLTVSLDAILGLWDTECFSWEP